MVNKDLLLGDTVVERTYKKKKKKKPLEYPTFGTGLGVSPYVDGAGLPLYVIEQVNDMSKVGDRAILVSPKKEAHHVGIVTHNYRSRIAPLGMRIVSGL